jgi:peroxiredoxin
MRLFIASLAVCATLLLLPVSAQNLSGRRAPSWSLPDTKMQQHDLLDYRGKWLLIEFLESKCPHCKALSKTLEDLKKRFAGKLEVVGVVIPPENMTTVGAYINETKITYPILFDSSQMAIPYFRATPQNPSFSTPHLFAVDPNGWLARDWGSARAEDPRLVKEIEELIRSSGKK